MSWDEMPFDNWDDFMSSREEDVVLIACTLVAETDKAWRICQKRKQGHREAWFPKSRTDWNPNRGELIYESWLTPDWQYDKPKISTGLFATDTDIEDDEDTL